MKGEQEEFKKGRKREERLRRGKGGRIIERGKEKKKKKTEKIYEKRGRK